MSRQADVNGKNVSALTFREAYLIINKHINSGVALKDLRKMGLFIPAAVNCAFSCEMFLKSFINNATLESLKIHKLSDLFETLKDETKDIIINNMLAKMGNGYSEQKFYTDLADNSNAFVDWRYFYEKSNHYSKHFMDCFLESLFKFSSDYNVGHDPNPDY